MPLGQSSSSHVQIVLNRKGSGQVFGKGSPVRRLIIAKFVRLRGEFWAQYLINLFCWAIFFWVPWVDSARISGVAADYG